MAATVYDADASVDARDAGGTLDLHADMGQIAIEDAGLTDAFFRLARPEGQAKSRRDHRGTLIGSFVPEALDVAAPEIDRGLLRRMIYEGVDAANVKWGHRLVAATPTGEGVHRLRFANGEETEVDLVIGADGTWSRVRPLVSDAVLRYTGITFVNCRFDEVDTRHPEVAALVGDGHLFSGDGAGHAIIVQRNSYRVVRGYLGLRTEADWWRQHGFEGADPPRVRDYLLHEFQAWAPEMKRFLTEADGPYIDRPIWVLPAPLRWSHTPGVTLLGDAAHVMAPFGGFGVNLALLDGAELARAIAEQRTTEAAVEGYEQVMLRRAGGLAPACNEALAEFFDARFHQNQGPDHAVEHREYEARAEAYRQARGD